MKGKAETPMIHIKEITSIMIIPDKQGIDKLPFKGNMHKILGKNGIQTRKEDRISQGMVHP